jgi:hypothetical protein
VEVVDVPGGAGGGRERWRKGEVEEGRGGGIERWSKRNVE